MTITMEQTAPGHARLHIEDEMTIYTAAAMKNDLFQSLAECVDLELDLSKVVEMDSAGFQILWALKRESLSQGKALRLVSHSPAVLDVLDTLNMANYFGDPVVITSGNSRAK